MTTIQPVTLDLPVPQEGEDAQNPLRQAQTQVHLPRVAIKYCTQCRWMLRAAYYAQELLSTFPPGAPTTSIGEIALIPAVGPTASGTFQVTILSSSAADFSAQERVLWDRRVDGGFPDVKVLKQRVRDVVDPGRGLGHVDRKTGDKGERDGEKGDREGNGCD